MFNEWWSYIKEKLYEFATSRLFIAGIFFVILFFCLAVRLFYLQVIHGEEYYEEYVNTTLTEVSTSAPRGNIYDRNGTLLAWNQISYTVTIRDTGEYSDKKRVATFNPMVYQLVQLLDKYNQDIKTFIPVVINEDGEYEFSGSQASIRLFIRDMYGTEKIEKIAQTTGEDVYSYTAEEIMEYARETVYGFKNWRDKNEESKKIVDSMSKEDELKVLNIRYALTGYSYRKYQSVTICSDVSDELSAAIMENSYQLSGVEIEQESARVYIDDPAFSHILGYTGVIRDQEECDELNEQAVADGYIEEGETMYELGNYVGRTGIEKAMDAVLQGKKGSVTMYLDKVGQVLETVSEVEAVVGNDVYLTLDANMQNVAYYGLEKSITTQLLSLLEYGDTEVYYQLINNDVISIQHFEEDDASDLEKDVFERFLAFRERRIQMVSDTLLDDSGDTMEQLSDEMRDYINFVYKQLSSDGVLYTSDIDTGSNEYQMWKEEQISPYQYFYYLVSNGWIDTSLFSQDVKYISSDEMYQMFIDYIADWLSEDAGFEKELYCYLIESDTVTPNEICLLLFDQGILEQSEVDIAQLQKGDDKDAYRFITQKIKNNEITPAQLAMDPCSGGLVATDPNTGEILAMVSYPGYDLNQLSGTIDANYWKKLIEDKSQPMYNNVTQTSIAPGSTYKIITEAAALNEGYVTADEYINCLGIYEYTGQKCWYYTENGEGHGLLNSVGAIANSCNYYFYEMGRRFSIDENGKMNESKGLQVLADYASYFGLNQKTGIELGETTPKISDELPISSAIGQGTNSYATIQLSRYVTAVANRGDVYEYSLILKVQDSDENVILEYQPNVVGHVELSDNIWDVLHEGMYEVLQSGTMSHNFDDINVKIAGKTGSAQEDLERPNHGQFISFAPYDDPTIAVNATVSFCGGSGGAVWAVKNFYYYYFDTYSYEEMTTTEKNPVDYAKEIESLEENSVGD